MPVINDHSYVPSWLFRSGHLNTIYPYMIRKAIDPGYQRTRLDTPDGDFIDIDTVFKGHKQLAVLCHGLEGSSESKYVQHTCKLLSDNDWDVLCMNYRGCSGEMNRKVQMYHSGFTADLHFLLEKFQDGYDDIALVGYSLGGNMVLKYIGDGILPLSSKIKAAVGISVPCDLHAGSIHISRWENKIYDIRFLKTLKEKIKLKHRMFPDQVDTSRLDEVKTLFAFDDVYTAPIHGFKDAADYYAQCHCKQFLENIEVPSLIITSLDDPFFPESSYPFAEAKNNENLYFMPTKYGGHVGFVNLGQQSYWNEKQILKFINHPDRYHQQHSNNKL